MMKWIMRFTAAVFIIAFLFVLSFAAHYTYFEFFARPRYASAASRPPLMPNMSVIESENAIVAAAEAVMPAVVSIETKQTITSQPFRHPFADDPFFRRFFGDDMFQQGQPRQHEQRGLGSGVIVDTRGYVLTNFHVIQGAQEIVVRMADGKEYPAKIQGTDERLDVAVIKIEGNGDFPTAALGNSDDLKVGMFVLAIGTPFNPNLSQTVTMGIVSALSRSGLGIEQVENFIQTDAPINQGNSGGPLVNLRGEVVGINVAIVTGGGSGNAGIGFAIPSNSARYSLESIVTSGKVVHGYLGVSIQNIDDELRQSLGLDNSHGALVSEVVLGSPADKAGIKRGDVVLEWNGRQVRSSSALTDAVSRTMVGSKAELKYFRNGKTGTVEVTVAERPANIEARARGEEDDASSIRELGLSVRYVEGRDAKKLGLPSDGCVVITEVEEGSIAERKGLKPGMGIVEVDRTALESVEDFEELLSQSGRHLLLIRFQGSSYYVTISK